MGCGIGHCIHLYPLLLDRLPCVPGQYCGSGTQSERVENSLLWIFPYLCGFFDPTADRFVQEWGDALVDGDEAGVAGRIKD